jgi:hypothetical protein
MRLRRVLQDREPVGICDLGERRHRRGMAVEVHRDDRGRPIVDGCAHGRGFDVEMVRLDVDEHRSRPGQYDGVGGGGETERRHDDLVTGSDAQREQSEQEGAGAGAHRDARSSGRMLGELRFERGDLRALGQRP